MFLKRSVHFLLVVLLLFADSGMTLYAHTCHKTKGTQISIGSPKHKCKNEQGKSNCTIKKTSCCDVSSKYIKQNLIFKEIETVSVYLPVKAILITEIFTLPQLLNTSFSIFSNPPPLNIKAEGTFTQTFRI